MTYATLFLKATVISAIPAARRWTEVNAIQFGISDEDLLALDEIRHAPTVDAVVVTRCMDCKHLVAVNVNGKGISTCRVSGMEVAPDEFCSRGEKGQR